MDHEADGLNIHISITTAGGRLKQMAKKKTCECLKPGAGKRQYNMRQILKQMARNKNPAEVESPEQGWGNTSGGRFWSKWPEKNPADRKPWARTRHYSRWQIMRFLRYRKMWTAGRMHLQDNTISWRSVSCAPRWRLFGAEYQSGEDVSARKYRICVLDDKAMMFRNSILWRGLPGVLGCLQNLLGVSTKKNLNFVGPLIWFMCAGSWASSPRALRRL